MKSSQPLVSCIMPTYNRRGFVPKAIEYFLRQDYPNRELIIIDDGTDAIEDLVPADSPVGIRYKRLGKKISLGAKRNLACREASGEIILHWDDDDWMAPHRIRYQVEILLKEDADICGLDKLYFYDPLTQKAWEYVYPKGCRPWLAGGTLCYKKTFWSRNHFPEIRSGEDTRFVWNNRSKKLLTLEDNTFYVALVHKGNTSPKRTNDKRWKPVSFEKIRDLMSGDLQFYTYARPLPPEKRARTPSKCSTADLAAKERVSCIMATCNRPLFFRQAIRCFLRQTYDHSELIVVDDGEQSVEELCTGLFRVRYLRLNQSTSLGEKLNIGIRHAHGTIIQKWDDDDYYHPGFLEKAVKTLTAAPPGKHLVAWDCFLVLLLDEMNVRFSGNGWVAGGTLCFRRELWEQCHFRDAPRAVDTFFIKDLQPKILRVRAPELYILVRHGRNTWNRMRNKTVDQYFQGLAIYSRPLENLVEPIDCVFYRSLLEKGR